MGRDSMGRRRLGRALAAALVLSGCGGSGDGATRVPSSTSSAATAAGTASAATAASTTPSPPASASDGQVVAPAIDWRALPRHDAPSAGLVVWGGEVLVRTAKLQRLDLAAGSAEPFALPGCDEVVAVSAGPPPAALCRAGAGVDVLVKDGAGLRRFAGPAVDARDAGLALAVDGESLVVVRGRVAWVRDGASYRQLALAVKDGPATMGGANHLLLAGRTLYLGYDRGEWGGALVAVDLDGGATTALAGANALDLPVQDIVRAPDGRVYVVRGLAHLGLREGELALVEGARTRLVTTSGAGDPGWGLPPADFDAVAFDAAGRLHLTSGALGLLRLDGATWVRLTPSWPDHVYLRGLALVGEQAIIGTYDAGVVVWELRTGRATRVPLPR